MYKGLSNNITLAVSSTAIILGHYAVLQNF